MYNLLCAETNAFSIVLVVGVCVALVVILIDAIRGIVKNAKKIDEQRKKKKQKLDDSKEFDSTIVDEDNNIKEDF